MAASRKKARGKRAATDQAPAGLSPPLKALLETLSSPRLKAPGTITSYMHTASTFLRSLGPKKAPGASDFRQWFIHRRQKKISERSLGKEFFHLKKLAEANGWAWPFTKYDVPHPEDEAVTPALRPEEVEQLIAARAKYSRTERFYLAVATTWIVRREDLCRIQKRHYDEQTFTIHHSKHGRRVKHLIPDVLQPIFADFRPKEHSPSQMSDIFKAICAKAGWSPRPGVGWHSLRRTMTTTLLYLLPANKMDPAILADYSGWAKSSMVGLFGGISMMGMYRRPEILDADPLGLDRLIYGIHPFLPLWGKKSKVVSAVSNAPTL